MASPDTPISSATRVVRSIPGSSDTTVAADLALGGYARFAPVVNLPADEPAWKRLDLTVPSATGGMLHEWYAGGYDEVRPNVYTTELFGGNRNVHIGVDFCAPVDTSIQSFADGVIDSLGYNAADGDYGHVIVVRYSELRIWALYGHLSAASIVGKAEGDAVAKGETIAWIGSEIDNGGWPPHLHFQLVITRPPTHDMPGVVTAADRADALKKYPDPRLVCGPVY